MVTPVALSKKAVKIVSSADEVVVLYTFDNAHPVSAYYQNFDPVSDQEVIDLLNGNF